MMMFMPVMFGVMMYGYAAGLSLYWLASSLVGIIESKIIKRSIGAAAPAAVVVKPPRS
jgi:membrane protein insertase Oxa1/YidC/SpoIIIJ